MDIVEFLTARYDEDEQLARHAAHIAREAGTSWIVDAPRYIEDYVFVSIHTSPPNVIEVAGSGFDGTGGIHGVVYAEHIARHDPSRVLADLAAKRAIVVEYQRLTEDYDRADTWRRERVDTLELVLRLLATPYADHPDFDPAWAVA